MSDPTDDREPDADEDLGEWVAFYGPDTQPPVYYEARAHAERRFQHENQEQHV